MQIRFTGIVKLADGIRRRWAQTTDPGELETILLQIRRTSRQVEDRIAKHAIPINRLTRESRNLRGWFAYFSEHEHFDTYTTALRIARPIFKSAFSRSKRFCLPAIIHFLPMNGFFKVRGRHTRTDIFLPTPMIHFSADQFSLLADFVFHPRRYQQQVLEWTMDARYRAVQEQIETLGGIAEDAAGRVHDLAESFERVNKTYFEGSVPRPKLIWSRKLTKRKFGHYDFLRDTVMISRSLDRESVPEFVVDYIVYHELLHKKLGLKWKNGRRGAHTPEFHREMKKFPQHAEAETFIKRARFTE